MKSIIAFLALIFGASGTGVTTVGGSVNVPSTWQPNEVVTEKAATDIINDGNAETVVVCAETLNVDDDIQTLGSIRWDPSNSEGAGSRECEGENWIYMGDGWVGDAETIRTAGSEVPFSTGADPYVYKGTLEAGTHNAFFKDGDYSDKTACVRSYRRYSPGTRADAGQSPLHRIKNITLSRDDLLGRHANFAHSDDSVNMHANIIDEDFFSSDSKLEIDASGGEQALCSNGGWCRLQVCSDHQVGAPDGSIQYRFYFDSLATGFSWSYTSGFGSLSGSPNTVKISGDRAGQLFFVQGTLDCQPDCYQYASHVLAVVVPYDTSYTIPAACELETPGGCDQ